jgi:hypothetical protein
MISALARVCVRPDSWPSVWKACLACAKNKRALAIEFATDLLAEGRFFPADDLLGAGASSSSAPLAERQHWFDISLRSSDFESIMDALRTHEHSFKPSPLASSFESYWADSIECGGIGFILSSNLAARNPSPGFFSDDHRMALQANSDAEECSRFARVSVTELCTRSGYVLGCSSSTSVSAVRGGAKVASLIRASELTPGDSIVLCSGFYASDPYDWDAQPCLVPETLEHIARDIVAIWVPEAAVEEPWVGVFASFQPSEACAFVRRLWVYCGRPSGGFVIGNCSPRTAGVLQTVMLGLGLPTNRVRIEEGWNFTICSVGAYESFGSIVAAATEEAAVLAAALRCSSCHASVLPETVVYVSTDKGANIPRCIPHAMLDTGAIGPFNVDRRRLPPRMPKGLVDLSAHVSRQGKIVWGRLAATVHLAARFLDGAYSHRRFGIIAETRRCIGIGITGIAECLIRMRIAYGSIGAYRVLLRIAEFVRYHAMQESMLMAVASGPCPVWKLTSYSDGTWQPPTPIEGAELWGDEVAQSSAAGDDGFPANSLNWDWLRETIAKVGIRNAFVASLSASPAEFGRVLRMPPSSAFMASPLASLWCDREGERRLLPDVEDVLAEWIQQPERLVLAKKIRNRLVYDLPPIPASLLKCGDDVDWVERMAMHAAVQCWFDGPVSLGIAVADSTDLMSAVYCAEKSKLSSLFAHPIQ